MVMDVHGRDLRYFVAVAEDLHFTRAAERLFISQPALSKQIRMLERQLGAPLFDRGREGVRLTPVGEALLPHAREVLAAWDRGWAEAEQAKSKQRATLVAGMSTSPGRGGLLPAIRSRFTALHPAATVQLRQVGWDDPTAGLADGAVDVAFVWLPLPDPDRYQWVVVAEEQRLVAMPDSHPLASRDVIDFADLLDEPFLALPRSAGPLRDYWLAVDCPRRQGAADRRRDRQHRRDLRGAGRRTRRVPAGGGQRAPDHPRGRHYPARPRHVAQPAGPGLARWRYPPAGPGLRARLPPGLGLIGPGDHPAA